MSLLRDLGYTHARHYRGGLNDWVQHGHSLEAGSRGERAVELDAPAEAAGVARVQPTSAGSKERLAALVDRLGNRSFTSLLIVWLVTALGCGVTYWAAGFIRQPALLAAGTPVAHDAHGLLTAVYFSFITAASVGYGDVVPIGWVRLVAIGEGITALFVFGLLVSKFVSRRQDQLIEEIHLITFEDRLDRVRTSLHLVLTELQSIVATCQRKDWPRTQLLVRTQSAAAVFTGQLRTVHDLLYRPLRAPEEEVLEGILAGLASGLQAFTELIAHLPGPADRPESLERSLAAMAHLAREICGECVPRSYAPELKMWMDRVQQLAGALTPPESAGFARA